jgi:cyclohexadienyl dehydratase
MATTATAAASSAQVEATSADARPKGVDGFRSSTQVPAIMTRGVATPALAPLRMAWCDVAAMTAAARMGVRTVYRIFAAVGVAATVVAGPAWGQESRLERGTLRVGTSGDFKPMSFEHPATGSYKGYDIDAVARLAADMSVAIEWVPTDWKTLVAGVVADTYDITSSASVSVDRAEVADYASWDDLDRDGVRVAVTRGTVCAQQARAFFDAAEIVTVAAPARGYQEVIAGRATATITSNVDAAQLTTTYPDLAVVPVDEPRSQRPGAFLLPQQDQVWINFVNHWIALRHADGFFDELMAEWNISR